MCDYAARCWSTERGKIAEPPKEDWITANKVTRADCID
jgi:hypothetical protein